MVPADQAVPLPDGVSAELGASLGVPAMTAHRCLFADGPLEGSSVLVAGGAGAVGHFAIELAKHAGARVAATVSGPAKAELAAAGRRRPGGELHATPTRPTSSRAFAPAGPRSWRSRWARTWTWTWRCPARRPHIVTYASEAADPVLPVRACMTANVTLRFVLLYGVPRAALRQAAADISQALADGALDRAAGDQVPPGRGRRRARRRRGRRGRQGPRRALMGAAKPQCPAGSCLVRPDQFPDGVGPWLAPCWRR